MKIAGFLFCLLTLMPRAAAGVEVSSFSQPHIVYDKDGTPLSGTDIGEFDDGTKFEIPYINGKANGLGIFRFTDGKRLEVNLVDGNADGKMVKYYASGQIASDFNYKDGLQDGEQKTYYEDGHIESILNYRQGLANGISRQYHNNGQLSGEVNMQNGLPNQTPYLRSTGMHLPVGVVLTPNNH